jgi:hypothetical protein
MIFTGSSVRLRFAAAMRCRVSVAPTHVAAPLPVRDIGRSSRGPDGCDLVREDETQIRVAELLAAGCNWMRHVSTGSP